MKNDGPNKKQNSSCSGNKENKKSTFFLNEIFDVRRYVRSNKKANFSVLC